MRLLATGAGVGGGRHSVALGRRGGQADLGLISRYAPIQQGV
jgi:hypothetical protein